MEIYATEEEQVEALKKWWRDNGTAVVFGVVVGLGGLFGWQGWQKYQDTQAEKASVAYMQVMVDLENKQYDGIDTSVDALLKDFGSTAYAPLAALAAAKASVVNNQYDDAKARLNWVINKAKQPQLVDISNLRLAQLQLAAGELDAALSTAQKDYPASYTAAVEVLMGDIYAQQGDVQAAQQAYDRALAVEEVPLNDRQLIEIKRSSLGVDVVETTEATAESEDA